jgi:LacI family transcriptional regulator
VSGRVDGPFFQMGKRQVGCLGSAPVPCIRVVNRSLDIGHAVDTPARHLPVRQPPRPISLPTTDLPGSIVHVYPMERVKMADVARAAGVSVATVSKVVNGRYGVSQATLAKVLTVIDDLEYVTSLGARSLRSHTTNVIGVLVAEFEPFSTELLKGVSDAINGRGYELLAFSGGHRDVSLGWERRSLSRLGGTLIDGAIIVTPTVPDAGRGIPVVAIDRHAGRSSVPTVDADNLGGAVLATEYLLGLGHRRIAHLAGRPDLESARLREQGFRAAMAAAGIAVDESLVRNGGYRAETATAPACELLTMAERPTAIFAGNDVSAIRTMEVARELGLRVPDDVSVVGFDNVPESALAIPALTTIDQPLRAMGATALDLLVRILQGQDLDATQVQLPTSMVERASCRALRPQVVSAPRPGPPFAGEPDLVHGAL